VNLIKSISAPQEVNNHSYDDEHHHPDTCPQVGRQEAEQGIKEVDHHREGGVDEIPNRGKNLLSHIPYIHDTLLGYVPTINNLLLPYSTFSLPI
jgi:hypothetical protein